MILISKKELKEDYTRRSVRDRFYDFIMYTINIGLSNSVCNSVMYSVSDTIRDLVYNPVRETVRDFGRECIRDSLRKDYE